jgi:O-antigen ligase
LIACLLLAASWLLPTHFPPWVSWHSEVLAFMAVFYASWQVLSIQLKTGWEGRISFPASSVLLVLLLLVTGVQGFTHHIEFAGDAYVIALYLLLCLMAMCVGYGLMPPAHPHLTRLAIAVLGAAVASVVIALAQVLSVWDSAAWVHRMPYARRPGANLGQPNLLATLLLMGFASLLYLYELRRLNGVLLTLLIGLLLAGLAIAESRTSWLSFAGLLLWWWFKKTSLQPRFAVSAMVASGLAFVGSYLLWPKLLSHLHFVGAGAAVDAQVGLRQVVWPQLMDAVMEKPMWGWGLREVSKAHNAVLDHQPLAEVYTYAHNVVLDLALGVGLPLTGLVLVGMAFWLWQTLRRVHEIQGWYCVAAIIPVAVHAMLEFPFAYAFFLAPVFFLIGQLERLTQSKPVFQVGIKPALLGLTITTLLAGTTVVEYIKVEEDFRVLRFETMRIGKTQEAYVRPNIVVLTQLDALLVAGRLQPHPAMSEANLDLARRVAMRFPWPATQNRYALALALNGQVEEAERQLRIMRALHTEKNFAGVREGWQQLAKDTYPQLAAVALP